MSNPFRFRELSPEDPFCNRLQEQKKLVSCAHGSANVVLFSPRRYGKTSLVRRVQARLIGEGFVTVYVDFFGVSSVYEVTSRIARSVYRALHQRESFLKKGRRFLKSFKTFRPVFKATGDGFGITVEPISLSGNDMQLLDSVMQELGEFVVNEGLAVNVVFDEFQEITRLKESSEVEGSLRTHIQRQKVSYFFVGSRRGVLLAMFNDRKRPFFQSAVMLPLAPLKEKDLIPFLIENFGQEGRRCDKIVSHKIVKFAGYHPYYIQRLAFEVFEISGETVTGHDVDTGLEEVIQSEKFGYEAILQGLSQSQMKLLKALAEQPCASMFSSRFVSRNALPIATVQHAKKKLVEQDLIEKGSDGVWRVADPVFAIWLQRL